MQTWFCVRELEKRPSGFDGGFAVSALAPNGTVGCRQWGYGELLGTQLTLVFYHSPGLK